MLVLGRNFGDTIVIDEKIFIKIVKGTGDDFKVAIDAPREIKIARGEVFDRMQEQQTRFAFLEGKKEKSAG